MSIQSEIGRIEANRNTIRAKLVEFGLAGNAATLDACAEVIEGIINQGAISVTVQGAESYTIPAGYHNGKGKVIGAGGSGNSYYTDAVLGSVKLGRAVLWSNKQMGAIKLGATTL